MIYKGQISAILDGGKKVTVTPYVGGIVTFPLVVPSELIGMLSVNLPIVYATFEDRTGIIISRADGMSGLSINAYSDGDAIVVGGATSAYSSGDAIVIGGAT